MATKTIRLRIFFLWWNFNLFEVLKITSGFTLTERWESGNYYIIFWSMTSKAEFSGEKPLLFYISVQKKNDIYFKRNTMSRSSFLLNIRVEIFSGMALTVCSSVYIYLTIVSRA